MESDFIVCQKCGEKNPTTNNFCSKCANSLKETTAEESAIEEKPTEDKCSFILCAKCGEKNQPENEFCETCTRPLNKTIQKELPVAQPNNAKGCIIGFLIFFITVAIFTMLLFRGSEKLANSYTPSENSYTQPTTYSVTYKVSGSASEASMTYSNSSGGTEQKKTYIPWQTSFTAEPSTFLYVSAQNQGDTGSVTCEIWVDGELYKTSTSSGAYTIASCSGSVE